MAADEATNSSLTSSQVAPQQYMLVGGDTPLNAEAAAIWEQALANASRYLTNLLSDPNREALFADVFGRAGTDAVTFAANLQALLAALGGDGLQIAVDLRSDEELAGAFAAYAASGHTGGERIYVNADKLNSGALDVSLATSVLLEELAHAMDRRLNGGVDSPGDEGQLFAAEVTGVVLTAEQRAVIVAEDDTAVLMIEGVEVLVEQAALTWDITSGDGATITGGTGTWTDGAANWNTGSGDTTWSNTTPDSTTFGGTAGTVTLGGAVTVGSMTFNAGTGNYTIAGGGNTLTLSNSTITTNTAASISAILGGTTGVIKAGAATLTLTGANTYSGGTAISTGTLSVGNGGTSGSIAGNVALANSSSTLTFNRSNALSYAGIVSGTGSVTKSGAGTLTLTGANTYSGGTTISAGTLSVGSGSTTGSIAGNVANSGILAFNRSTALSYAGIVSGTGAVKKSGAGTLTLTGDNTYTGVTTISAGTLSVGSGSTTGTIAGNVVVISGTLAFNRSDALSYAGIVSGAGAVTKSGEGTLTLTGDNTYGGGTYIYAGTLSVGNGGTSGSIASNVALDNSSSTLTFNRSDALSYAGIVRYTGSVTKSGAGMLTLTGANTYSGVTTISAGTLDVSGSAGALTATSAVNISGGTLLLSGSAADRISNSSSITLGAATNSQLQLSGAVTETLGSLTLSGAGARVIDFGSTSGVLTFASLTAASPLSLQIWNWSGTTGTGGGTDRLIISSGSLGGSLSSSDISFYSDSGTSLISSAAMFNGTSSELVPDTIPPTVTISDNNSGTANIGQDVTFTFTFSEAVSGFSAAGINVDNGSKGTFTAVSSTSYTLVVTPTASSSGNVTIDVAASAATDAAGNGNIAPTQYLQPFDTAAPTVTISDNNSGTANIGQDVTFTFTFSEAVSGFSAAGINVDNGSKGTFTAVSSTSYTLVVTPTASSSGNVTIDVAASAATDAAGNGNTAPAQYLQPFDTAAPTTTVSSIKLSADSGLSNSDGITNIGAQAITATLSTPLAAAAGAEPAEQLWASTDNGTTWSNITGFASGTSVAWNTTLSGSGTIVMQVLDAAGNNGPPSAGRTYIIDQIAPTTTATVGSVTEGSGGPTIPSGGTSNGTAPLLLSGSLSASLVAGETVQVFDGNTYLGSANVPSGGTSWSYSDLRTLSTGQIVQYTTRVADLAGNQSAGQQNPYNISQSSILPVISINNAGVVEGNTGIKPGAFTVSLSRSSSTPVTVKYEFLNQVGDTATPNTDYTAISGQQTLTFNPGVIALTIGFTVNGDTTVESDETFSLKLSNPTNATFASGAIAPVWATTTIINDDTNTTPTNPNQGVIITASGNFDGSDKVDTLTGDGGVNQINGLAGNDTITGLGGADGLSGGAGADTFTYLSFTDSTLASMDFITDFNVAQTDKIDLPTVPTAVWNRGLITASTLQGALQLAFDDKDPSQVGNQALGANEIVVFQWGTSIARRNTYIASPDGNTSNFDGDLLIKLPNNPGIIAASTFI